MSIYLIQRNPWVLTDPVMSYPIGIPPLDKWLGPAPGELTVILAPPNRGGTQFCVHIAKSMCLNATKKYYTFHWKCLKIHKNFQSLFAISKRQAEVVYTAFNEIEMVNWRDFGLK